MNFSNDESEITDLDAQSAKDTVWEIKDVI